MKSSAEPTGYDPAISWSNLVQYVRAVREFTRAEPPELPASAFERISETDWDTLPAARMFRLSDGGYLGFRHYAAPHSGRTLVLVHGSACFGDQLHGMAEAIAEAGLAQVFTLNMRGHGLSGGARGHAVDAPNQMVCDIEAFVRRLKSDRPHQPIVLGGHSAGGGLVLGFSRTPAARLASGFLFIAPFLGLGSPVNRPYFGGWARQRNFALRALVLANLFGIKRFNDVTVVDFDPDACGGEPRYTPGWSFNTLLAFGPGRWVDDAPPIPEHKPVLVLAGSADECFVQPLYRQAFDRIAPQAEIPDVGPVGHWDVMVEPRAIAALAAWLCRLPAYRAPDRTRAAPTKELVGA